MRLLCAWIHVMNAKRNLFGDEIAGCFLHSNLAVNCWRHVITIPVQSAIIVSIKEVHFTAGCPYIGMQSNEFEQCSSAAFLNTNDKHLGQVSIQLFTLFAQQPVFRSDVNFIEPGQWHITNNCVNQLNFKHLGKIARRRFLRFIRWHFICRLNEFEIKRELDSKLKLKRIFIWRFSLNMPLLIWNSSKISSECE